MKKIIVQLLKILYKYLPKNAVNFLGQTNFLKQIRESLLRPNGKQNIIKEKIKWGIGEFYFYAPIRMAVKAKKKGIESKLITNSISLINKLKSEECVILDIGANYGFISLALSANLTQKVKIFSFEPHPEICASFTKSITENLFKNIKLENLAIGNEDNYINLNLYGQTSNILDIGVNQKNTIKIKQIKLDNYLNINSIAPNFIKIDVDGYEIKVLEGLKNTLINHRPILVVETNDDIEVLEFFKNLNYCLLDLDMNEFTDIPNNIFCIPND